MGSVVGLVLIATVVGACLGSFVVTAALRSLDGRQALVGRSACDTCGVRLGFVATVPVFSYAALGGSCRHCHARIDPMHPIAEVLGGLVALLAFLVAPPSAAALIVFLGMTLLATAAIDQRSHRLPDKLTLLAVATAISLSALKGPQVLMINLAAGIVAFVLLECLRRGYARFRGRPGLGFGDVKLFGALALWLGTATPWALVFASTGALVAIRIHRPEEDRLAFGPFLAGGGMAAGLLLEAGVFR